MRGMIAIGCALAMICGGAQAQGSGAQATAPKKPHASMKKKTVSAKKPSPVAAVAPAPPAQPVPARAVPPVPATLMNSAPVNPNVTMANGLLTIDAPNSTLSDVLKGVHTATGAEIEGASPSERVAVRLGPGDPRQVIAALLEGTPYDYLILGSQQKPDVVTRIVLTQSQDGTAAQNVPAGRPQPPMPQPQGNDVPDASSADDVATQSAGEVQAEQTQQAPEQNPPNAPNPPKTPDQLFRELQPAPSAQPAEPPKQ
jgi:hypothetical protein